MVRIMRKLFSSFILGIVFIHLWNCSSRHHAVTAYQYLGQKPPGSIPEVFAPGIISGTDDRLHGYPAFAPDGREVYWPVIRFTDERPKSLIMFMKQLEDGWSSPESFQYSGDYMEQAPHFSYKGNRLYFQSARPGGYGSLDIWYVEKTDTGWAKPVNMGRPVNTVRMEAQPSFTKEGTVYFAGYLENSGFNRGIYRSLFVNGEYGDPELLGKNINTEFIDAYPFISSDESFLLFSSTRPSMEEKDMRLYISFQTGEDTWMDPLHLSRAIHFDQSSRFPSLSPDGKYIFFCSGDSVYWVDGRIIEQLRPIQ